jgi:drug/metabolite transporter (DMT)-like permease
LAGVVVEFVGIAAALCLGVGYVLQQRVAMTMPISDVLRWRLLLELMHRRLWWIGIACMIAGQALAGWALQLATVAAVEPLLSTSLLFALAFAAILNRQRIRWQEVVGALLLSAALAVFIEVGNPRSSPAPATSRIAIVVAVAAVLAAVAVLVAVARRRGLVVESILLATGAGLLYGLQDAATRAALVVLDHHGFVAMMLNLWVYVVVGSAAVAILLTQSAFETARLDYSLPPIAAAEPIAGIVLGISLLGDVISLTVLGVVAECLCLVAMMGGAALIARSPNLAGGPLRARRRGHGLRRS